MEGRSLRRAADGREPGGRAGLRRVAPPPAPVRLGAAPRLADDALQADRGAAAGALRPRRRTRARRRTARARGRGRGSRAMRTRAAGGVMATTTPRGRPGDRRRDRRAPRGARLRRRRAAAARPPAATGRDPKDGIGLATRLGRNGMSVARTEPREGHPRADGAPRRGPGHARGPPHAGRRLRDGRAVRGARSATCGRSRSEGRSRAEDSVVLGDNLRLAGPPQEATEVLERTAREEPEVRAALALAGRGLREGRRRSADAAAAYEKVLAIAPDHIEALRGPGRPRAHRGRRRRGGEALRPHPRVGPGGRRRALTKLGVVRMRTGRADGGDRPLPQGGRARAEERRGPALPGGGPRLERASPRRPCPTSSGRSPRTRARRWRSTASA